MPELHKIYKGTVTGIKDFGAFIQFQQFKGMVHISQFVNYRLEAVSQAVRLKDEVWVKVISLDDNKVGYGFCVG